MLEYGMMDSRKSVILDISILTLFWVVAIILVNPFGNFPQQDDWIFAKTVKSLLETGSYRPLNYTAMTLITHVMWGALFCSVFGFSFEVLRLSILLLGLAGVIGTYCLLKEVQMSRARALICSLIVAVNPIYFSLSNTFMTDITFTFLSIVCAISLIRYLNTKSDIYLIIGIVFAVLSVLCRQLGLFIPLAFAVSAVVKDRFKVSSIIRAVLPGICAVLAMIILREWLEVTHRLPVYYDYRGSEVFGAIIHPMSLLKQPIPKRIMVSITYLGIFILPLLILLPKSIAIPRKTMRGMIIVSIIIFIAMFTYKTMKPYSNFPMLGLILNGTGIGPMILYDTLMLKHHNIPIIPNIILVPISLISIWCGAWMIIVLYRYLRENITKQLDKISENSIIYLFMVLACILYMGPVLFCNMTDRYLMPLVPFVCCAVALSIPKVSTDTWRKRPLKLIVSIVVIILYGCISIGATRDYLAWNRTRWEALNTLIVKNGISAQKIDGGMEFNGWYLYDPSYTAGEGKGWWWVSDNEYLIAMGPVEGYKTFEEFGYSRWLPPMESKIFVLRKEGAVE